MNARIAVVAALVVASFPVAAEAAKQVMGTVESVNPDKNELKLSYANEQGEQKQVTLKWTDDVPGVQSLESARVGGQLTVEAEDSFGAWEVARVITDSQATPGTEGASRQY